MPNPYDEEKRNAQVGILQGGEPASNTMPVGRNSQADFLAITKRFSPNPSGLTSLMGDPEFKQRFPSARVHKNDWLDLGDGSGLIDTVRGFNPDTDGGEAWQWLTEADAIQNSATQQGGQRPQVSPQALMASDNSAIARIMAELTAASQGQDSPAEREAMLALLQGGI